MLGWDGISFVLEPDQPVRSLDWASTHAPLEALFKKLRIRLLRRGGEKVHPKWVLSHE